MNDTAKSYKAFDTRLKGIAKRKTRLERGYKSQVTKDGLIIFRPDRRGKGSPFTVRRLLYIALGFLLFKAMIMANLGGTVYEERVAALQAGTIVEQMGSYVMQPDGISQAIAVQLRPFLSR
jgi:hypothetical protein